MDQGRLTSRRKSIGSGLLCHIKAAGMVMSDLPEVDVSPDSKDNPILATAVASEADLLVSGSMGDLLALGNVEGIPIVTARAAIGRLQRRMAG